MGTVCFGWAWSLWAKERLLRLGSCQGRNWMPEDPGPVEAFSNYNKFGQKKVCRSSRLSSHGLEKNYRLHQPLAWLPWVDCDLDSIFPHLWLEEAYQETLRCLCGIPLRGLDSFIPITRRQAVKLISLGLEPVHSAWVLNVCLKRASFLSQFCIPVMVAFAILKSWWSI